MAKWRDRTVWRRSGKGTRSRVERLRIRLARSRPRYDSWHVVRPAGRGPKGNSGTHRGPAAGSCTQARPLRVRSSRGRLRSSISVGVRFTLDVRMPAPDGRKETGLGRPGSVRDAVHPRCATASATEAPPSPTSGKHVVTADAAMRAASANDAGRRFQEGARVAVRCESLDRARSEGVASFQLASA